MSPPAMTLPAAKRVLMCLRYGIGDVVMEMPVLETLRRTLPDAFISGLGAGPAVELLENDPRLDAIFTVQDWGLGHWGDGGTPQIDEKLQKWLAEKDFDLILDPSHAVIAVREAIWKTKKTIFDSPTPFCRPGQNGPEAIRCSIRDGWGMDVPADRIPALHISRKDRIFAQMFLNRYDLSAHRLAAISPVASSALKQWPQGRLAEIAGRLVNDHDFHLLVFCGPGEDAGGQLLEAIGRRDRVVAVGALHLQRVAALLARMELFVCNDTGLMHMAAAAGTAVAAVFGPTSPALYLPPGPRAAAMAGKDTCEYRKTEAFGPSDCIVQGRCLKEKDGCIEAIGTDQVMSAIEKLLGEM